MIFNGIYGMITVHILDRRTRLIIFVFLLVTLIGAACTRDNPGARHAEAAPTDADPVAATTPFSTAAPTTAPTATPAMSAPTTVAPTTVAPTAVAVAAAAVPPASAQQVSADLGGGDPAIQAGIDVYLANYCGLCHALTIAGTKGVFGPNHDDMGRIAEARVTDSAYTGAATTAREYIYESLVDPRAFVADDYKLTRHPMPAFTHLSEDDLNALVALLLAQK